MGLRMNERRAVTREIAKRYHKSSKKQRGKILDEFTALMGYNRSYASHLLSNWGRKIYLGRGDKTVAVIFGEVKRKTKRRRHPKYDKEVLNVLRSIWMISDYLCGKRLYALLKEIIPKLEKFREIKLDAGTRDKLLKISPATIDRLLREDKKKLMLKSRARTKPGTLLKHQIPIRTFSEWDELRPGFVEIDLVGHDGGDAHGEFAYTLNLTDVYTGWAEMEAIRRGKMYVMQRNEDGSLRSREANETEKTVAFAVLKNNVGMIRGEPDRLAEILTEKSTPEPKYDMEPGISLEFLRHITADAIDSNLAVHEKIINNVQIP
ncbi:TPA: hypothetical protein ENS27_18420 [bacterium]|nr:hypothetical protein [bacterium]